MGSKLRMYDPDYLKKAIEAFEIRNMSKQEFKEKYGNQFVRCVAYDGLYWFCNDVITIIIKRIHEDCKIKKYLTINSFDLSGDNLIAVYKNGFLRLFDNNYKSHFNLDV